MTPKTTFQIIIDSREQTPLPFSRYATMPGTLYTGDYSIVGMESIFSIERKSVDDLTSCVTGTNRERFERELHRLRGYWFKRLLVIGTQSDITEHKYTSRVAPNAVLATLHAFEIRYDCPVVFAETSAQGAAQVERWAFWFHRKQVKMVGAS